MSEVEIMKKIGKFFKDYVFYAAIGVICIGALAAIFLMPNHNGNVKDEANPYAKNEMAEGTNVGELPDEGILMVNEDDLDTTDEMAPEEVVEAEEEMTEVETEVSDSPVADKEVESATPSEDEVAVTTPETFESTTVSTSSDPFFAEGDTFVWPVEGEVVVPYTDESTKYWYSESLNQTMRTFGICIGAEEGSEVKAVAKGTVTDIIDDSSTYLQAGMPYVGKLMVLDHGNGYTSIYGFQAGEVNEALLGQVVNEGDVLGTIGGPRGAFVSLGNNIYLQVTHNDKVVNPLNYLESSNQVVKEESVDLGFAE